MTPLPQELVRLSSEHDRSAFSCGQSEIDRFFQQQALQNQRRGLSVTYVWWVDAKILGFVTVVPTTIAPEDTGGGMKGTPARQPQPALLLARMGVASAAQGQGLGVKLLIAAFILTSNMSQSFGCAGMVVDAKEGTRGFYGPYFQHWAHAPNASPEAPANRGFIALKAIQNAVTAAALLRASDSLAAQASVTSSTG